LDVGSNTTGGTFGLNATLGTELAPVIAAGNYTVGTGWESPIAGGQLNKNADGTGTAVPSPALSIVAGTTYKVVITVGSITNRITYTLGAANGTPISDTGTFTDYIVAANTTNLIFTPYATGSRVTITAISVKAVSSGTSTFEGQVDVRNGISFSNIGSFTGIRTAKSINSGVNHDTMAFYSDGTLMFSAGSIGSGYVTINQNLQVVGGGILWLTSMKMNARSRYIL